MYGGTKRSYKQLFISLVSVLLNDLIVRRSRGSGSGTVTAAAAKKKEERNANLIPHEPLATLYSQDRAEDAHGGTPAARTSGARVRDWDGLSAAGHGIGRIIGTLFALVAFLWIA
jgi:hypothetical protein